VALPFVTEVTNNATAFLQRLPPGVFLGLVLIAAAFAIFRSRLAR
jgi:Na+-translocating ferredoxin:NAD+ oxidoreductase RnfE subunit